MGETEKPTSENIEALGISPTEKRDSLNSLKFLALNQISQSAMWLWEWPVLFLFFTSLMLSVVFIWGFRLNAVAVVALIAFIGGFIYLIQYERAVRRESLALLEEIRKYEEPAQRTK